MPSDSEFTAHQNGRSAAFAHEAREANPYESRTSQHAAWELGYDLEATELSRVVTTEVDEGLERVFPDGHLSPTWPAA